MNIAFMLMQTDYIWQDIERLSDRMDEIESKSIK